MSGIPRSPNALPAMNETKDMPQYRVWLRDNASMQKQVYDGFEAQSAQR